MAELVEALAASGLGQVRVDASFDCFAGTSKEGIARKFGVHGINLYGSKRG